MGWGAIICVCVAGTAGWLAGWDGQPLGHLRNEMTWNEGDRFQENSCSCCCRAAGRQPSAVLRAAQALSVKPGKHCSKGSFACLLSVCSLSLAAVMLHRKLWRQTLHTMDIALALSASWLLPPAGGQRAACAAGWCSRQQERQVWANSGGCTRRGWVCSIYSSPAQPAGRHRRPTAAAPAAFLFFSRLRARAVADF